MEMSSSYSLNQFTPGGNIVLRLLSSHVDRDLEALADRAADVAITLAHANLLLQCLKKLNLRSIRERWAMEVLLEFEQGVLNDLPGFDFDALLRIQGAMPALFLLNHHFPELGVPDDRVPLHDGHVKLVDDRLRLHDVD